MNNLADKIPGIFLNAFEDGIKQAVHILWIALLSILREHWLMLMLIFFVVVVLATFKAMMGHWGSLGSITYNSLYFGTLFIIGIIKGPEVFVSDFFSVFTAVILYPICYILTGLILRKIRLVR